MNNQNDANLNHISIEELSDSAVAEIREDLSDSELNGITGGISPIDLRPIKTSGCSACCSGYDPRFEERVATYSS